MSFFFLLHILGAIVVGFLSLVALYVLLTYKNTWLRFSALSIAIGGVFQVITGSLLALQLKGTLFSFCARITLYLLVMAVIEGMLFFAMQKKRMVFPVQQVVWAFSVCVMVTVWTGLILVL